MSEHVRTTPDALAATPAEADPAAEPPAATEAPAAARTTPMARLAPWASSPWAGRLVFVAVVVVLLLLPGILGDPVRTRQWSEYLCYAMIAVGIDLAWGYGGMLTLGQGVFFGLGAYAMGMHLSLEQVGPGQVPQFMALYSDYTELPMLWRPFESFWFAALAAVIVPMLVAAALGLLLFRRRIRGPYFAIITQATSLVMALIVIGQLQLTAGTNGLTNFTTVFGRSKYDTSTIDLFYYVAVGALLVCVVVAWQVVRSRFGRLLVATRDAEDRVRFLGYDPALVKTVTFALSAGLAGLAGALAAPIIGLVAPNQFNVLPSVLMVCWVAVGGRGTLWGAVLGALLVNWTKTNLSESWPTGWVYLQGLLFVVVVGLVPGGIAGLVRLAKGRLTRPAPPDAPSTPSDAATTAGAT